MPHAKIDVVFIREHFAAVPEKTRPAALALYLELVVTSAELLLDGHLPLQVVLAGAHEIGISRGRYGRAEVSKISTSLTEAGLVEVHNDDTWQLTHWAEHHNAREYVEGRRKQDADRKAKARGQLSIGDDNHVFHTGRPQNVRSGHGSDSRAHARRRSESESESETKTSSSSAAGAQRADDDDDDLSLRLEHLGVNDRTLIHAALNDPQRATAWIAYGDTHATGNPAGYFRTNFTSGHWPPTSNGKPQTDPAERRHRWLSDLGWRIDDDILLDTQLADMGADTDERISLLETAHDLRRQHRAST
ncbi:MAG: hypothetical protein ACJ768_12765 [Gaiellaceae bacterium]